MLRHTLRWFTVANSASYCSFVTVSRSLPEQHVRKPLDLENKRLHKSACVYCHRPVKCHVPGHLCEGLAKGLKPLTIVELVISILEYNYGFCWRIRQFRMPRSMNADSQTFCGQSGIVFFNTCVKPLEKRLNLIVRLIE